MGWLSSELSGPDAVLLRELQRAYADEWFAHYNYYVAALLITGSSAASVSALLREKSGEALRRADRLAERLIELGGGPIPKLVELIDAATDKPFKLPEDTDDVRGLLRAVLDAERTSMRTHHGILDLVRDRDPLTAALALELLTESTRGEQMLEKLLGEQAPDMTGK
jgi:bacterioferritin